MGLVRWSVASVTAALAVVACGSTTSTTTAPPATPTPAPTSSGPSGPPKAQVTLAGDASLAGGMTISTIECSYPSVSGEEIFVTGTLAASPGTSMHLTLSAGNVAVIMDTGSGTSFHAREFSGTGVTGFDAATGAQLDGPVTETTPATSNGTGIGRLTSISGSIDCAGQTPGTSTLAVSGTVTQGAASGSMTSVRVVCLPANNEVETFGLTQVGGAPNYTAVFAFSKQFTVDLVPPSGPAEFFTSAASASVTVAGTSATIDGDATESLAAGATASTIHVSGQSTCGSSITP